VSVSLLLFFCFLAAKLVKIADLAKENSVYHVISLIFVQKKSRSNTEV